MRSVRRERTRPEEAVAQFLRSRGIHYRRNVRALPGSPDFANSSRRFAIFVNGCFWHRHPGCRRATTPKSNAAFWQEKFAANIERDGRKLAALRERGFTVSTIWECECTSDEKMAHALGALIDTLDKSGAPRR